MSDEVQVFDGEQIDGGEAVCKLVQRRTRSSGSQLVGIRDGGQDKHPETTPLAAALSFKAA